MIEWFKIIHILAVISWMAGLLYLPRLFVYHAMATPKSEQSETFKVMEAKLYRYIMNPAMMVAWVFGLLLAYHTGQMHSIWFALKLACVVLLTGAHIYLKICMRAFAADANSKSTRFFRILNEVPTILMLLIVILVVIKPFS